MNPLDQERLLREAMTDDALETIRTKSLTRGVAALKVRRRNRRVMSGGAAAVAIMALAFSRWPQRSAKVAPSASVSSPATKTISDEELLALFPTRSVALIGPSGRQELIFLDELESRSARGKSP